MARDRAKCYQGKAVYSGSGLYLFRSIRGANVLFGTYRNSYRIGKYTGFGDEGGTVVYGEPYWKGANNFAHARYFRRGITVATGLVIR